MASPTFYDAEKLWELVIALRDTVAGLLVGDGKLETRKEFFDSDEKNQCIYMDGYLKEHGKSNWHAISRLLTMTRAAVHAKERKIHFRTELGRTQVSNRHIDSIIAFLKSKGYRNVRHNDLFYSDEREDDDLHTIMIEQYAQIESELQEGDSVLIFVHTLEYDMKQMFTVVHDNLNKGVKYYFILVGGRRIKRDWSEFLKKLKNKGAQSLPKGKFEKSKTASLINNTVAVHECSDDSKQPFSVAVLTYKRASEKCIVQSESVAHENRDTFWDVWHDEALEDLPSE